MTDPKQKNDEIPEKTSCINLFKDQQFLKKIFLSEISSLDQNTGKYDTHSLLIKGWAITLWTGLMYFALKEGVYFLLLIQIITLLLFWSFDGLYKGFQRSFALRFQQIQKFFENYKVVFHKNKLKIKNGNNIKNSIPLINPRANFGDPTLDKMHKLRRCLVLRVVSVIYIYLISATFLLSAFIIIKSSNCCHLIIMVSLSVVLIAIGIINYIWGHDTLIEGTQRKKRKINEKIEELANFKEQVICEEKENNNITKKKKKIINLNNKIVKLKKQLKCETKISSDKRFIGMYIFMLIIIVINSVLLTCNLF